MGCRAIWGYRTLWDYKAIGLYRTMGLWDVCAPQARMERDLSNRKMYQEEELPGYGL